MHKNQKFTLLGIGALGVGALILSGCGGTTFQKNTFGNYTNTVPAAYGVEPVAASSNLQQIPQFYESSGLASANSAIPYLTEATDFAILLNPNNAGLANNVDPNGTGKVPLGFSTGGSYIDALNGAAAAVSAAAPGASVVFRAALANGIANNSTPAISTVTLTSTDAQWTLGTLPMTFNNPGSGPLANGTYVTGTGGTVTPFTLPFRTSGIHTVAVTVTDSVGQKTETTFGVAVVTSGNVALFAQNIVVPAPTSTDPTATKSTSIAAGDNVTIDGGPGLGTYPTGYTPTKADTQGTVVFFVAPGTHTLVDTTQSITQTITIAATAAGTTIIQ